MFSASDWEATSWKRTASPLMESHAYSYVSVVFASKIMNLCRRLRRSAANPRG
jgi:hypothetical protein